MTTAPERIHNWLGTQLSLARFSGGITYNGHSYLVAYDEEGQPLVRRDVIQRERRQKAAATAKDKELQGKKQEQLI